VTAHRVVILDALDAVPDDHGTDQAAAVVAYQAGLRDGLRAALAALDGAPTGHAALALALTTGATP
jgi:hypothetical protein